MAGLSNTELLINVSPYETRVALVLDGLLNELHLSRRGGESITGNVYLGTVERVIGGMQAAFVDIGLARPGFLHVRDMALTDGAQDGADTVPDIRGVLRAGDEVMVQVTKDPISSKGARLTTDLAIASRYAVLMPLNTHIGISQRISDEEERNRLRDELISIRDERNLPFGLIVRTAAEGASREQLTADVAFLHRLWDRLLRRKAQQREQKKDEQKARRCLYEELPVHIRMVRDVVSPDVARIIIDDVATFSRVQSYVNEFLPEFSDRLQTHDETSSLFARYGIDEEISRALSPQVELRCGGSIVIEQTEAMTTIDVNTGAYLGSKDLEETVFRTNLEAASVIPRQLRLRNLGGIVVIDFIDMATDEHQRQVLRTLEKAAAADSAKIRIEGFSGLGLVQLSRKRTSDSLVRQVCEPCDHCGGTGLVQSAASTCVEILRAVSQHAVTRGSTPDCEYLIRAEQVVVDRLLEEDASHVEQLTRRIGLPIRLQVEPSCGPGQFDVVLVQPGPVSR